MKLIISIVILIVLVPVIGLAFLSWTSPPPRTGLLEGRLRPCPDTPNCVLSEGGGEEARIPPLSFEGPPARAWAQLRKAVTAMGGTIQEDYGEYLWATFTSRVFRFVDDVEFRLVPSSDVIQVRSASRVGRSDLGVNRKRVERLRARFRALSSVKAGPGVD
jgi:uncharacterized protein (DUF1499 family)